MTFHSTRKELNIVQVSILCSKSTHERYVMPSAITAAAIRILTCVGLPCNEVTFHMPPERTRKTGRTKD